MSRIDRIRRAVQARSASRTEADRPQEAAGTAATNLPVPVGPVIAPRSFREERRRGDSELAAQLLGQDGLRRGLRAGPNMVDIAQAAYNRVEWSGSYDRRARKGRQARTEI
jgi:hypothetical protein